MANGICVFAENYNGKLEPVVAELIRAAQSIKQTTGEKIQAAVLAENCDNLVAELEQLGVEEIYALDAGKDCLFQDDAASKAMSEMLTRIAPSSVLVPATPIGRSIFSRVAARLGCGMTADCTDLAVDKREDGSFYIKQNKPSFGENVFVTIVTKQDIYPQMMTVRPGVYTPCEVQTAAKAQVTRFDDITLPASGIEIIASEPAISNTDSILAADVVVVGGRGAESEENFNLLKAFADKLGAAIGGTRPLVDTGFIPFEHQIGQTGYTIRPKICISLGVSGAIQHTEGIKDTKLLVAINQNESEPIFNIADYGMTCDMKDVLAEYLKL